mgnify:CR=1 FL=1
MKIEPAIIQVRYADVDSMGHVNNAVYLSYFENARLHYFKHMLGSNWDWKRDGIILLKNEVQYIKSVLLEDVPKITISVEKIGGKSFVLGYELKVDDIVYCVGSSTLVCYDSSVQAPVLIPELMRVKLEELKAEQ